MLTDRQNQRGGGGIERGHLLEWGIELRLDVQIEAVTREVY